MNLKKAMSLLFFFGETHRQLKHINVSTKNTNPRDEQNKFASKSYDIKFIDTVVNPCGNFLSILHKGQTLKFPFEQRKKTQNKQTFSHMFLTAPGSFPPPFGSSFFEQVLGNGMIGFCPRELVGGFNPFEKY